MDKNIKLLSLNCRGLHDIKQTRKLFQWLDDNDYDIVCLQETYCTNTLRPKLDECWKGECFHAITDSSHSRGVSVLLGKKFLDTIEVVSSHYCKDGRKIIVNIKLKNDDTVSIASLYAPNIESDRKTFFKNLPKWLNANTLDINNLIACGDYNCCLYDNDRVPQSHIKDPTRKLMSDMMRLCDLTDIWQVYCSEPNSGFTYYDKKVKCKSRLDYALVSTKCCLSHTEMKLVSPIKGDHLAVYVKLIYKDRKKGPGYWKLNNQVLEEKDYIDGVCGIIRKTIEDFVCIGSDRLLWELIKINVKEYSIAYCKSRRKRQIRDELMLQSEIDDVRRKIECLNENHDDVYRKNLIDTKCELEEKLSKHYDDRVKGAQIRSRAQWVEEGEKNSRYFINLEKERQGNGVIYKLKQKNGNIIDEENDILNEIRSFYSELYRSECVDVEEIKSYIHKCETKKLTTNDKELCDREITMEEVISSIDGLKKNKSPGLDGLTPEFYKVFKNELIKPLYNMIVETHALGSLPDSARKAVVTLIYKKGSELELGNYRPISLTNYDYKIIAFTLASRMQNVLPKIVDESQTAYIINRYLGTNVRLIQDLIQYCNTYNKPGIIVGIDFQKAFDSLEWPFIVQTLKKFNFGEYLIKWIEILYNNPCTVFKNNGWITSEISPTRGIRQGCPVSSLLYILCAEILASQIRNCDEIKGICVGDEEFKSCQHADDTFVLVNDVDSLSKTLCVVKQYSRYAGTKINVKKSEGMWLGIYRDNPNEICEIRFDNEPLRCLGIYIGHDVEKCNAKNWKARIEKIERILERWKKRNLTIFGKITVLKSLIMSTLIHNFSLLETPESIIHDLEKIMYEFVWDKRDRIKRNTVILPENKGGISMIDVLSKIKSIKASWVKRLKSEGKWKNVILWYLREYEVDVDYMLKMTVIKESDCKIYKHLPVFYREVFINFNECKKRKDISMLNDYEYLSSPIMGNSLIQHRGKSIFFPHWIKSNIKYVKDLYDNSGNFITEEILLQRLNNKSNWIVEYSIVKKAVRKYSELFRTGLARCINIKEIRHIVYNNKLCDIMTLKSKQYYNIMIHKKGSRSHMESVWSKEFKILKHPDVWSHIYNRKVKRFPVKKVGEFNYKILQNILCTGYKINKWNKSVSSNCHCGELHTPKHLLFDCNKTKDIWNELSCLLKTNITWKHIVIGCDEYNLNARLINVSISIATYIIYCIWVKCSYSGGKYDEINIYDSFKDRYMYYGKVLEKTQLYTECGKHIQLIAQSMK